MVSSKSLLRQTSAWLPIAMSIAALSLVPVYLVINGVPQQPAEDEGTAAHLFQLLMAGQVPIIAFFAIKWLPKKPKEALVVLVLQFIAGVLAFVPVYILEH